MNFIDAGEMGLWYAVVRIESVYNDCNIQSIRYKKYGLVI